MDSKELKGNPKTVGQAHKGKGVRTQEASPSSFNRGTPNKNVRMIKGK